jgi:hypothetical protein
VKFCSAAGASRLTLVGGRSSGTDRHPHALFTGETLMLTQGSFGVVKERIG